jgi:hypothetical protein
VNSPLHPFYSWYQSNSCVSLTRHSDFADLGDHGTAGDFLAVESEWFNDGNRSAWDSPRDLGMSCACSWVSTALCCFYRFGDGGG